MATCAICGNELDERGVCPVCGCVPDSATVAREALEGLTGIARETVVLRGVPTEVVTGLRDGRKVIVRPATSDEARLAFGKSGHFVPFSVHAGAFVSELGDRKPFSAVAAALSPAQRADAMRAFCEADRAASENGLAAALSIEDARFDADGRAAWVFFERATETIDPIDFASAVVDNIARLGLTRDETFAADPELWIEFSALRSRLESAISRREVPTDVRAIVYNYVVNDLAGLEVYGVKEQYETVTGARDEDYVTTALGERRRRAVRSLTHTRFGDILCACNVGPRPKQDDNAAVMRFSLPIAGGRDCVLLLVSDGMGGHLFGSRASLFIKRFLKDNVPDMLTREMREAGPNDRFDDVVLRALVKSALACDGALKNEIRSWKQAAHDRRAPEIVCGATLVLAAIVRGVLYAVTAGDSRLYLAYRGVRDGTTGTVSIDDTGYGKRFSDAVDAYFHSDSESTLTDAQRMDLWKQVMQSARDLLNKKLDGLKARYLEEFSERYGADVSRYPKSVSDRYYAEVTQLQREYRGNSLLANSLGTTCPTTGVYPMQPVPMSELEGFCLCSDGICGSDRDGNGADVFGALRTAGAERAYETLARQALTIGTWDNMSAVIWTRRKR